MSEKLAQVLKSTQLSKCSKVSKEKLITIHEQETVGKALEVLSTNGISSAPVVDSDGDVWGVIDILDIVTYLYHKLDPEHSGKKLEISRVIQFLNKYPIVNIGFLSTRSPWVGVPEDFTIHKVRRQLSHPNVHRVYLVDSNNKPCGVFTQKNFVEFLYSHKDDEGLQERMNSKVGECWPDARPPRSIGQEELMLTAFRKISQERISGLAVVNFHGVLVGNISATDLKKIPHDPNSFVKALETPIREYLAQKCIVPVVVEKHDTIAVMTQKTLEKGVHRVFVVDSTFKPTYEISLCDIIAQFAM